MHHILALLMLTVVSVASYAEHPTKREVAERLVEKLDYSQQIRIHKKECHRTTKLLPAEELVDEDPEFFSSITPKSEHWPLVRYAYEEYNRTACDFWDESDFLSLLAREYTSRLSLQELHQALAFYDTPVGQKMTRANVGVAAELQKVISSRYAEQAKKAQAEFARKIAAIRELHEQDREKTSNHWLNEG